MLFEQKIKKIIIPQQQRNDVSNSHVTSSKIWDPVNKEVSKEFFSKKNKKLNEKFQFYLNNPHIPIRNLLLFSSPNILLLGLFFFCPEIFKSIKLDASVTIFVIFLILPLWYWRAVNTLQKDLVKYLIAKEKNWIYNPEKSSSHWSRFRTFSPVFFNKGDRGQLMQDEFWGKFKGQKKIVDFYSSVFEYQIKHRSNKGKTYYTNHFKTIFSVRLDKKLNADFRLEPENIGTKFLNFFSKKEINTESSEFNKLFAVFYNGRKDQKALEIVKTLSPALQIKLVELSQKEKFSLLFRNDIAIFMINGKLLPRMKTNFFRAIKLHPADKTFIENRINTILDISSEMMKYLD